jgi:precorrin-2 methylase
MVTDNEIIKALECCQTPIIADCIDCPNRASGDSCVNELMRKALDLINRQKAEIERLETAYTREYHRVEHLAERVENTRAEAVKEFAEKLKAKEAVHFCKCGQSFVYTDLFNGEIDNILNEMVDEEK